MGVFMRLQEKAIKDLRLMTESCINTAHFLEQAECTRATRLPDLVRYLGHLGLDYHQDDFLYKVVELQVVSKLRGESRYSKGFPVSIRD